MAVTIFWSDEAKKTYSQNIEYLKTEWSVNELKKFILRTEYVVLNIETNPMLYSLSIKKRISGGSYSTNKLPFFIAIIRLRKW